MFFTTYAKAGLTSRSKDAGFRPKGNFDKIFTKYVKKKTTFLKIY